MSSPGYQHPWARLGIDALDYPALFRSYVIRGAEKALAGLQTLGDAPLPVDERERCLHALSFILKLAEEWPLGRALLLGLAQPMEMGGYRAEWIDFLRRGVTLALAHHDSEGLAQLYLQLGILHWLEAEFAGAVAALEASRRWATQAGCAATWRSATVRLADVAIQRGDYARAAALAEAVLGAGPAPEPSTEPPAGEPPAGELAAGELAAGELAAGELAAGELAERQPVVGESVGRASAGRQPGTSDAASAAAHSVLGYVALQRGAVGAALAHYHMAYDGFCVTGSRRHLAQALRDLGEAYLWAGQVERALPPLIRAIDAFDQLGDCYGQATARMHLGMAQVAAGEVQAGLASYQQCAAQFRRLGCRPWLAKLYNNIGLAQQALGQAEAALAAFTTSLELAWELHDAAEAANTLDSLAGFHLERGEHALALHACQEAAAALAQLPQPPLGLVQAVRRKLAHLGH